VVGPGRTHCLRGPLSDIEEFIAPADKVIVMTAGPGAVKQVRDICDIDLPRPRKAESVHLEPRFIEMYREIRASLGEEVRITRERGAVVRPDANPREAHRPGRLRGRQAGPGGLPAQRHGVRGEGRGLDPSVRLYSPDSRTEVGRGRFPALPPCPQARVAQT
jgi:hypothetical protein